MRRFYRISLLFVFGGICFILGMWFSFMKYFEGYNESIPFQEPIASSESFFLESDVQSVSNNENEVDCNTVFEIVLTDLVSGESKIITEAVPDSLLGLTRSEVETYFQDYEKAPSLNDRKKGFVSLSLREFSGEKVVIEKFFSLSSQEEIFYLKAEENYVVVYCQDLRTVYMYTEITLDSLPVSTQEEILNCKKIESADALYGFLESYTS